MTIRTPSRLNIKPTSEVSAAHLSLVVSLTLLVAFAVGAYFVSYEQYRSDGLVTHTQKAIFHIAELQQVALDAESTGRAYLLTGEAPLFERHRELLQRAGREVGALRPLLADDPAAVAYIDVIENRLDSRFSHMARLLRLRQREGLIAAAQLFSGSGAARDEMAYVRSALTELKNEQNSRLRERLRQREQAMDQMRVFTGGGVLAALLLLAWLYRQTVLTTQARLSAEQQTRHMAYHDPLTGLPNRRRLQERLVELIESATARNESVVLMVLDLDGFKPVNDTLGHDAGDELLVDVAQRLRHAVREDDMVARLGGDEFVLLFEHLAPAANIEFVADKLLEAVGKSYALRAGEAHVTASIGIAVFPQAGKTPGELFTAADHALYAAKAAGKQRFCTANPLKSAAAQA